jgi:hypothetical protein
VGKVIQEIKVKKLSSGTFKKSVKVMSNATNASVLSLSISGKILTLINMHPKSFVLKPDEKENIENKLTLSTEKRNLQILEMTFEKSKTSTPTWQEEPPLTINYQLTRSDTADADGYYTYSLNFSFIYAPSETISGYFYLNTNHPEMKTIKIRGIIKSVKK